MKNANCSYKAKPDSQVSNLVSSIDPLNSSRLPIGTTLQVHASIFEVPPTGRIEKAWEAVKMVDPTNDEAYFTSPRVFKGLAWQNGKFTEVVKQPFPAGAILDYMKTLPKVKVIRYEPVSVDVFGVTPLTQDTRDMPVFEIVT